MIANRHDHVKRRIESDAPESLWDEFLSGYQLLILMGYCVIGPMIYWFHPSWKSIAPPLAKIWPHALGRDVVEMAHMQFFLFFVIPMFIIIFLFRENPLKGWGLGIGNWKEGLIWTAALAGPIVILNIIFVPGTTLGQFYRNIYYAHAGDTITLDDHLRMFYASALQLFAWEYLLRGFLLKGVARHLGAWPAILIQMMPFAFLHLPKPEVEAMSTPFTGILFGIIAWRTQTFLYVYLIHVIILVSANLLAAA